VAELAPLPAPEPVTIGDITVTERDDLSFISLAIPDGGEKAFAAALKKSHGLAMPTPRISTAAKGDIAMMTSPDQILLLATSRDPSLPQKAAKAMGDTAYMTDQTGAYTALQISGPGTLAALERLCPLDLHDTEFPTGAFARTVMEHIAAIILRTEPQAFLLLSPSSSALSFRHAVETSCRYVASD